MGMHQSFFIDSNRSDIHFQIRLVDGNNRTEGRVEINYNGVWGTVCDDNWDLPDAQVVCRQLGFDGALEALSNAHFGAGDESMPILLDDVICFGNEAMLSQCLLPPVGQHNCRHFEDAGVRCYGRSILPNILCSYSCPFFSLVSSHHSLSQ